VTLEIAPSNSFPIGCHCFYCGEPIGTTILIHKDSPYKGCLMLHVSCGKSLADELFIDWRKGMMEMENEGLC